MTAVHASAHIGPARPPLTGLCALPLLVAGLLAGGRLGLDLGGMEATAIAAVLIVVAGLPHGTLDVEIAARRFGCADVAGRAKIIAAYVLCAAAMLLLWSVAPAAALVVFLVMAIVHFSRDWRMGADPFLAFMVGWALVGLPALSHPDAVAMIFEGLTGQHDGATIAAILACASVPAALGSLVFAFWAWTNAEWRSAVEVVTCLAAAMLLPPLVAFAVFFCCLHSPRHMADALRETAGLSAGSKAGIMLAVFALSIGLGVLVYLAQTSNAVDASVIRTAFILISTLTVPHFLLELGLLVRVAQSPLSAIRN